MPQPLKQCTPTRVSCAGNPNVAIFEHPKKDLTKKFIQRLSTITYRIESRDFDFEAVNEELQQYAEKLLIENERTSKLLLCMEELIMNNLFEFEED